MLEFLQQQLQNLSTYIYPSIQLAVAFVLALPIAWERERSTRLMGLRTFPIVAVASCGYALIGIEAVGDDAAAKARLIQGLMTGIGFIGGGAILKEGNSVRGTATAASAWTTGAVGAAVAFDNYAIAIVIVFLNYLVLRIFTPLKDFVSEEEKRSAAASESAKSEAEG